MSVAMKRRSGRRWRIVAAAYKRRAVAYAFKRARVGNTIRARRPGDQNRCRRKKPDGVCLKRTDRAHNRRVCMVDRRDRVPILVDGDLNQPTRRADDDRPCAGHRFKLMLTRDRGRVPSHCAGLNDKADNQKPGKPIRPSIMAAHLHPVTLPGLRARRDPS